MGEAGEIKEVNPFSRCVLIALQGPFAKPAVDSAGKVNKMAAHKIAFLIAQIGMNSESSD